MEFHPGLKSFRQTFVRYEAMIGCPDDPWFGSHLEHGQNRIMAEREQRHKETQRGGVGLNIELTSSRRYRRLHSFWNGKTWRHS